MFNCLTNDDILVCLKYELRRFSDLHLKAHVRATTYARTFENSVEGDMTKLSLELDHEIKCWML